MNRTMTLTLMAAMGLAMLTAGNAQAGQRDRDRGQYGNDSRHGYNSHAGNAKTHPGVAYGQYRDRGPAGRDAGRFAPVDRFDRRDIRPVAVVGFARPVGNVRTVGPVCDPRTTAAPCRTSGPCVVNAPCRVTATPVIVTTVRPPTPTVVTTTTTTVVRTTNTVVYTTPAQPTVRVVVR